MSDTRERWEQLTRELLRERLDSLERRNDDELEYQLERLSDFGRELNFWLKYEASETCFSFTE